jgi:hypothetical protein
LIILPRLVQLNRSDGWGAGWFYALFIEMERVYTFTFKAIYNLHWSSTHQRRFTLTHTCDALSPLVCRPPLLLLVHTMMPQLHPLHQSPLFAHLSYFLLLHQVIPLTSSKVLSSAAHHGLHGRPRYHRRSSHTMSDLEKILVVQAIWIWQISFIADSWLSNSNRHMAMPPWSSKGCFKMLQLLSFLCVRRIKMLQWFLGIQKDFFNLAHVCLWCFLHLTEILDARSFILFQKETYFFMFCCKQTGISCMQKIGYMRTFERLHHFYGTL